MKNYLVDFINTASTEQIQSYLTDNQCTVLKTFNSFDKVFLVSCDAAPPISTITESIIIDDTTTSVFPLEFIPVQVTQPSSTQPININDNNQWWKVYSIKDIDFTNETVNVDIFGEKINIYIVDSGIDISHQEFQNKDITLLYSVNDNFDDTTGHGTALSSIILGNTCGITNSSLKVLKLWDASLQTLQSQILSALDAILIDAMSSMNKFSIVNMSWVINKNTYIENKLRVLAENGIALVAAAGNSGTPIENITPASMPEVLTVGAYNQDFFPCDFSNYTAPLITSITNSYTNSGQLDVWAPGIDIYAARAGGGYGLTGGTSAAAAIYSASLAYHQSQLLTDTNNILSSFYNPNNVMDWNNATAKDRNGLLNLDDPKYLQSINKVCTFRSYIKQMPVFNIMTEIRVVARVTQTHYMPLFVVEATKSYEIITELPPDVRIERNYICFSPITDTADPTNVEITPINYRYVDNNNQIVDNVVQVVKVGSEFDVNQLPDGDVLIGITQAAPCGYAPNDYTPNCGGGYCPPGEGLCQGFPKYCMCGSDIRFKTNIRKIGTHSLGIGYYEYDMFGKKEQGVMAQELQQVLPQAVHANSQGFLFVDYGMIGRNYIPDNVL